MSIDDKYKKSVEKTAAMFNGLVSPEEIYECVKHIDIEWARSLLKPLENPIEVTLTMPPRYGHSDE